jgi:hypothetical protein
MLPGAAVSTSLNVDLHNGSLFIPETATRPPLSNVAVFSIQRVAFIKSG